MLTVAIILGLWLLLAFVLIIDLYLENRKTQSDMRRMEVKIDTAYNTVTEVKTAVSNVKSIDNKFKDEMNARLDVLMSSLKVIEERPKESEKK